MLLRAPLSSGIMSPVYNAKAMLPLAEQSAMRRSFCAAVPAAVLFSCIWTPTPFVSESAFRDQTLAGLR